MLVLLLAAALIWMLNRMPKQIGIKLYVWYFLMLILGAALCLAVLKLLGR